jgi:hypothetical protein
VTARINFAGADQLTPDGTAVTEVNDFIRAGVVSGCSTAVVGRDVVGRGSLPGPPSATACGSSDDIGSANDVQSGAARAVSLDLSCSGRSAS